MNRRFILKGDKTDRNGVVLAGIAESAFFSQPLAYIRAAVFCHTCNTQGVIVEDGPARTMTVMGKTIALENDLCKCGCEPPPKLIASQVAGWVSV